MKAHPDIEQYCVRPTDSVLAIIQVIEKTRGKIALVVNDAGVLLGTVTDGDVRRFLLKKGSFNSPCGELMCVRPTTARLGTAERMLVKQMRQLGIRNIPLLDEEGRPCAVANLQDIGAVKDSELTAVIMAGGEGKRLLPLTERLPKPMVSVGGKPILEDIVARLSELGFRKIFISVNYHAEVIENHFGDGSRFGVSIQYLREKNKLGTAGALAMLPQSGLSEHLLVMNGDLMTRVNFGLLFEFHRQHRSVMTIAASQYNVQIPYGVLKLAGHYVLGIEEKPRQDFLCSAGIYVIDSSLLRLVPRDTMYNMTDLLADASREGLPISAFPIHEYWVDVGQIKDLDRAREDATKGL